MEKQKKEHLTISETLVISCEVCAVREGERDIVEVGGKREREDDEDRDEDGDENEYQSGNKDEENIARKVNEMGEGGGEENDYNRMKRGNKLRRGQRISCRKK